MFTKLYESLTGNCRHCWHDINSPDQGKDWGWRDRAMPGHGGLQKALCMPEKCCKCGKEGFRGPAL